jgi:spore maturation protein CgeB
MITDASVGLEMFLAPGREVLVARDGADVTAFLDDLTPARALEIGQAARRRILAEHTYEHRAATVVAALEFLRTREASVLPFNVSDARQVGSS